MNCVETIENLSAYQDGELSPAEAAALEAHLASCEACRRRLEEYEAVWRLLGEPKPAEPSPGFTEAVLSRAAAPGFAVARRRRIWAPAAAVAASLLLVAGLLFWASPWGEPDAVEPAPPPRVEAPDASAAEVEAAVREDPELLEILENLDALEQIEVLENLPILERLDEIQSPLADDLEAAADDLVLDADFPLEEK
jgi:anti-sigma factor RsiW